MNEFRKEKFRLNLDSKNKLKRVEGFTEGREYEIIDEKLASGNFISGMTYKVKDDDGNLRHVNSNYFVLPEIDLQPDSIHNNNSNLTFHNSEIIDNLKYDNLIDSASPTLRNRERKANDLGFAKIVTLEEKLKAIIPEEPNLEMKVLSGLRDAYAIDQKNSFEIMQDAINTLSIQINALQKTRETLSFELNLLKRLNVLN